MYIRFIGIKNILVESAVMTISIITITKNNLDGLKKTFNSVQSQLSLNNIEYIIIDGNSQDGTKEFLNSNSNILSMWISEDDRGISEAFNKGLKFANGEYIIMLNSGDIFISNDVIKNFISKKELYNFDLISFRVLVSKKTYIPSINNRKKIWENSELPHQATFVSKKVYEKIGYYNENYRIRMDFEFFARCKKNNFTFSYIPIVIVKYEPGGISMLNSNKRLFWLEGISVKLLFKIKITFKDILKFLIASQW